MAKHKGGRRGAVNHIKGGAKRGPKAPRGGGRIWLHGGHAVLAALANPRRRLYRLLVTEEAEQRLGDSLTRALAESPAAPVLRRCGRAELEAQTGAGAVHQGLALEAAPLEPPALEDLLAAGQAASPAAPALILALDQVTDPHNVGAVLRSAAAFGAAAVIAPGHHAAPESGVLAKAASGALERVPYAPVGNLSRALEAAAEAGFARIGLDAGGETTPSSLDPAPRLLLVLGAEGGGLRRLTREHCDRLVRLPTLSAFDSLNISNAAAVALYELLGRRRG